MDKEDKGELISMNTDKVAKIAIAAILIIAAVAAGFFLRADTNAPAHPMGIMTGGDERIHPCGTESPCGVMIPMDEMIYVPAYPDEECELGDRVLLDMPIRIVDTDGTVYYHWVYENSSTARNR
jgi:hypothetical protein